ncbi:hypothetical protein I4U23_016680 [Adineta vaga]|nr:hypothetical protein I4U23_016680 [Adineta vaga]
MTSSTKEQNRRKIIHEFCSNTSAHALPGIARSESLPNRLFWSISFVIFTGIMIYFVITSIIDYFNYPTKIDLNIDNEWPQYFPAFSFCNFIGFRSDRFLPAFINYTQSQNFTTTNDTTTWTSMESIYIRSFAISKLNRNESIEDISFSLSSLLYSCRFNGQQCSINDFIPFYSSSHGSCYTFNPKMKTNFNQTIRYGNENGGNGEFTLELYIHSYQYVLYIREGIGIVGLVHDNTQLPLIEFSGLYLIPGRRHKLDYSYSTTICTQTYIYDKCGCVNPSLWNIRSIMLPNQNQIIYAPLCEPTNNCYREATNSLLSSDSLMNIYCSDCEKQCSTTDFLIQTSSLLGPSEWQIKNIEKFVNNSGVPTPNDWSIKSRDYIINNYVSIIVIRETTLTENNTQTSTMGLVDVLSNIGGQTGLWIGMSFLSLMEVIEMIYRLIRYQCHSIRSTS